MKKILLTVASHLAILTSSVTFAETFTHVSGSTDIEGEPKIVLVFDMAALDTLDTLGIPVTGVTKPHALGFLSPYADDKYVNLGTFFEPDFETTAAIQPDLIIVGGRTQKQLDSMGAIAPTIDVTVWGAGFLDQFYTTTELIADIFNVEKEAQAKLNAIKEKVNDVNELAKTSGNALFILTSGGKISAYGPGSRYGWLHDELGVEAAVQDVEEATHGDPISFEFLQEVNPDWLFVLDRDAAIGGETGAAKALLDNDLIRNLNASKNNQIVYVDSVAWYMVAYGLTAVDIAVSQVKDALRK